MTRVLAHYEAKYGKDSRQVRECFEGAHAEPHVSSQILNSLIAEQKSLTVFKSWRLSTTSTKAQPKGQRSIVAATFDSPNGVQQMQAAFWIDGTYEGDLAASAGVPYLLGRESTREYGEHFAGVLYFDQGKILPGSTGEADDSVQCSNFRIIMTEDPALRVSVPRPATYSRDEFTHLLPYFTSGKITQVYSENTSGILRLQRIPNGKADMNDIKQAPIRLALPGENQAWPEGDWAIREKIAQRHLDYAMGLLYFLQNDPDVPSAIRDKAKAWGLSKDEFTDNRHLPTALYIREGRRIEGLYTFTEHDTQPAANSVRTRLHQDSIAIGDYALNSHGQHPPGPLYPTLVEGDFGFTTAPFQIPYGVIVPKNMSNLLVPVAISASHVGYSALRLEPTWTALGHAAGLAAHLSLANKFAVGALQSMLHAQGQATTYVTDVSPSHQQFKMVQWAGLNGFLSDVVDYRTAKLEPLRHRHGLQYSHASPLYQADLNTPMDARLTEAWRKRLPCAAGVSASTRGEFLQKAQKLCVR